MSRESTARPRRRATPGVRRRDRARGSGTCRRRPPPPPRTPRRRSVRAGPSRGRASKVNFWIWSNPRPRYVAAIAPGEHQQQIRHAGAEVDRTQAGHASSNEVVRDERPDRQPREDEVVALPEGRPRQNEEQESDLEEERHVDEPPDERHPFVCTFARRSTRSATSRN